MADEWDAEANNGAGGLGSDGKQDNWAQTESVKQAKAMADAEACAAAMGNQSTQGQGLGAINVQALNAQNASALGAAGSNKGVKVKLKDQPNTDPKAAWTAIDNAIAAGTPNAAVNANGNYVNSKDFVANGYAGLTDSGIKEQVLAAAKKGLGSKFDWQTSPDAILNYAVDVAANKGKSIEAVLADITANGPPKTQSGGGSGGPFQTVSRSVQLTNEGTARRLINTTLSNFLGREASDGDVTKFLQALNKQEKLNPTETVTKGVTSGRNTTQTSNTTGGFDASDFAERYAKAQKGAGEYQAATTYMDAFMQAINDPMRMV